LIPIEKAKDVLREHYLCDPCLGRQFAYASELDSNQEIGREIRGQIDEARPKGSETCYLCHPLRDQLETLEATLPKRMEDIEFDTFLVGISIPDEVVEREDELRMRFALLEGEALKREFSRSMGKKLADRFDAEIEFENPDVAIIFDLSASPVRVRLQINPAFVYGRYLKLERGIFQNQRYCQNCGGEGCEKCLFTGYEPEENLETMISTDILEAFRGEESKFHGAGREDYDARMLGNGRPFVVEVLEPKIRSVDYSALGSRINSKWKGRVEIRGLRASSRREMQHIKTEKFDKTYEVIFSFTGEISGPPEAEIADEVSGAEIRQQTPTRVMERRKDTTRRRVVKDFDIVELDPGKGRGRVRIKSESGFYVKEFITGDQGRTQPNLRDLLGAEEVKVESLDVVRIHDDEKKQYT
jgi:tRNA pseudouridine synthase 10